MANDSVIKLKVVCYFLGINVCDSCLCSDKEGFYVIGGKGTNIVEKTEEDEKKNEEKQSSPGKSVKCFNVLSHSWSELPNLKSNIRLAGLSIVIKNYIAFIEKQSKVKEKKKRAMPEQR